MSWARRQNAPAPTDAQLRTSAEIISAEVEALSGEAANIRDILPQLITDPIHWGNAESRLRDIEALLPTKRRTLEAIRAEIPRAERRVELEELEVKRADLDRRTAKLSVGLRDRYNRAAAQFAAILEEMDANATEWERLRMRADGLFGVRIAGEDAETRLRKDLGQSGRMGASGWQSLHQTACVLAWDGSTLFEGADA